MSAKNPYRIWFYDPTGRRVVAMSVSSYQDIMVLTHKLRRNYASYVVYKYEGDTWQTLHTEIAATMSVAHAIEHGLPVHTVEVTSEMLQRIGGVL